MATKIDDTFVPTDQDMAMASEASCTLAGFLNTREGFHIELHSNHNAHVRHLILPPAVLTMVQRMLTEISQGNPVTVMPMNAELTTQEAAEFLNVSRPFIVKQLEADNIPYRKVGTHRRISVNDLVAYKRTMDKARHESLDKLVKESQRLGLGY